MTTTIEPAVPHRLRDCVLRRGDPGYDDAVAVFSVSSAASPAFVARCADAAQVQEAVAWARDTGLALSVKGGGHDWAGRALCGGLTIDLSPMREIDIASDGSSALVGGGCLTGEVLAAAGRHGRAAVTGSVGGVGLTGLTLGGGYGPLIGRFGLALDNMLGAEIVLADGRLVTTDATREPDLFWALRGGGGNFGVVTRLKIKFHDLASVHGGIVYYPLDQAQAVLFGAAELLESAPEALTAQIGIVPGPTGAPVAMVAPLWCGDPGEAENRVAPFTRLGTPEHVQLATSGVAEAMRIWDAYNIVGARAFMANRRLARVETDTVEAWIDAIASAEGAPRAMFTHELRGAASRVAPDATAFGLRDPHVLVEILGLSPGPDGDAAARDWAEGLSSALEPGALPGGYANLLVARQARQVAESFGGNAVRIAALKRRYDPNGLFRSAIPLPPV